MASRKKKKIGLVMELEALLKERQLSAEAAASFIGRTPREVRRWLDGEFVPTVESRKLIRRGIRRIKRIL